CYFPCRHALALSLEKQRRTSGPKGYARAAREEPALGPCCSPTRTGRSRRASVAAVALNQAAAQARRTSPFFPLPNETSADRALRQRHRVVHQSVRAGGDRQVDTAAGIVVGGVQCEAVAKVEAIPVAGEAAILHVREAEGKGAGREAHEGE